MRTFLSLINNVHRMFSPEAFRHVLSPLNLSFLFGLKNAALGEMIVQKHRDTYLALSTASVTPLPFNEGTTEHILEKEHKRDQSGFALSNLTYPATGILTHISHLLKALTWSLFTNTRNTEAPFFMKISIAFS